MKTLDKIRNLGTILDKKSQNLIIGRGYVVHVNCSDGFHYTFRLLGNDEGSTCISCACNNHGGTASQVWLYEDMDAPE